MTGPDGEPATFYMRHWGRRDRGDTKELLVKAKVSERDHAGVHARRRLLDPSMNLSDYVRLCLQFTADLMDQEPERVRAALERMRET